MSKDFKIQIHNELVKNKDVSHTSFVVAGKLIQKYYSQKAEDKSLTLHIDHKQIMYFLSIAENRPFKEALNKLYAVGFLEEKIETLPRRGYLSVTLNKKYIENSEGYFTQMNYRVFNKEVIDQIGHTGIRLLYYYESFINHKTGNHFCFVSIETTERELGISKKTIITYHKKLVKLKFIRIIKHKLENSHQYDVNDKPIFVKYHNHYYVQHDKIAEFNTA